MRILGMLLLAAALMAVPVMACPEMPDGCTCENFGPWHNGRCPAWADCCQERHVGHWLFGHWERRIGEMVCPDPEPDPTPTPVPVPPVKKNGIQPFSDSVWQTYTYDTCTRPVLTGTDTLPVTGKVLYVNVVYGSELDGFMARTLSGEESCYDQTYYNLACKGERLYGMSSGGLSVTLVNPQVYLEVLAVKNTPEWILPMTVTVRDDTGHLYFQETTTDPVYHKVFTVPGGFFHCRVF